ncbi:hypothetical protein VB711_04595 [Cronbergia sp. UHCC 0137]|uniref:hypothetical protein n=1 Tax=Cronbergia sp. UHCC 0137 TaxID=3110239 RepID=UPI002B1FF68D|nr:hypothetical protein [Cronbergia sp. UHCC 0137]MEA5617121.1 hypothetical protein [Cronbergia sp. UHCC 0137]
MTTIRSSCVSPSRKAIAIHDHLSTVINNIFYLLAFKFPTIIWKIVHSITFVVLHIIMFFLRNIL